MRSLRILISILLASAWPLHARAAPQWCTGTVSQVWVDSGGNVHFVGSWRGDHTIACNVNEPRDGVSPVNCMTWFASLQSAIVQFRRAIEFDPRFALAHAALADAHTTLGYLGYVAPVGTFPVARPYALKAL